MFPVLPSLKFWWVLCEDPCYILTVDGGQESRGNWSKTQRFGFFLQNAQKKPNAFASYKNKQYMCRSNYWN